MKEVTILGLFSPEVSATKAEDFKGEIWSLTDWYRVYPWLPKIDRLYQLHTVQCVADMAKDFEKHNRYPGDWESKYEDSEALIIVDDPRWCISLDAEVEIIRYDYLKKKYPLGFVCSIDIMLIEAIESQFTKINIEGVYMFDSGHEIYIKSIIKTIDFARDLGIEVNAKHEDEWRLFEPETVAEDYIVRCRK